VPGKAVVRPSARIVVLDPAGRILLLGARLTALDVPPGDVLFWYTPGGGVEGGESLRTAAVRELAEEIGLDVDPAVLEGPVWLRRFVGPFRVQAECLGEVALGHAVPRVAGQHQCGVGTHPQPVVGERGVRGADEQTTGAREQVPDVVGERAVHEDLHR